MSFKYIEEKYHATTIITTVQRGNVLLFFFLFWHGIKWLRVSSANIRISPMITKDLFWNFWNHQHDYLFSLSLWVMKKERGSREKDFKNWLKMHQRKRKCRASEMKKEGKNKRKYTAGHCSSSSYHLVPVHL